MSLIATHDSATGEPGKWWCWWLTPFSRTQSKNLVEQLNAGCRLFDIRVRKYRGDWHFAHGLWISKETIWHPLDRLSSWAYPQCVYVSITYEGKDVDADDLKALMLKLPKNIYVTYLAVKYGTDSNGVKCKYSYFYRNQYATFKTRQGFLPLDGRSWHTYLPIPWLWNKIYTRKHEFNDEEYTYVDFL